MQSFVIFLRAIGPVTHRLMSMAQWRAASEAAGFGQPQTYVSTGNMLVEADDAESVAARTETILRSFGLADNVVPIVRQPAALAMMRDANRFSDAAAARPQLLAAIFAQAPADFSWVGSYVGSVGLQVVDDRHLIVDYPDHASISRLAPTAIERRSQAVLTARNWNTLLALHERAAERAN